MDLQELRFVVKTEQLDEAAKRIQALGTAIADLESKQKSASQVQKDSAKAERQALKDAAELEKLKKKLAQAEADAAAKADGTTKKQANAASKLDTLLNSLKNTYVELSNGQTRSEAKTINLAKSFGASVDQLKHVRDELSNISTLFKDPFDGSLGALRSIEAEKKALQDRNRLANEGILLTSKQLSEYSRIGAELRGQMRGKGVDPTKGEGLTFFDSEMSTRQSEYANKAKEVKELRNAEAQRIAALASQKKAAEDLFVNYQAKQKDTAKYYQEDMQKLKEHYSAIEALDKNNVAAQQKSSDALFRNKLIKQKDDEKAYRSAMQDLKNMYAEQEREALSAEKYLNQINQRIARDAAASRYIEKGSSVATANYAAGMEVRKVDQSIINTFVQSANAKEKDAKASRELRDAHKYVIETEEKLAAAVNNTNQNLNRQATDELVKYQNALHLVGTSAVDAEKKLVVFKAQQETVAAKAREGQLNHLSRGISTQMGDVGISLASGMNPLTVALQQGDQIRFLLQQANADGAELQKAMNGAVTQIASSSVLVLKAVGGFFTGIVTTSAKAIASLITGPLQFYKDFMAILSKVAASSITQAEKVELMKQSWQMLGQTMATLGKTVLGLGVAITVGLGVGLYKVIVEQQNLAKQLALTGGSMGVSMNTAVNYAQAMNEVGISTGRATEVITMMAKEGAFLASEIALITKAAVDMEHYAGVAVEDTVKQFANLRKDPVKAILELSQATGMIAPEVVRAVIELKEQGRTADAVALAMKASADVSNQTVSQLKEDFTGFALLMKKVSRDVSDAFAGMFKGMWVKTPVNEALRETREGLLKQVEDMEKNQAGNKSMLDFLGIKTDMSKLDELKGKLASVNRQLRNEDVKGANAQRDKEDQSTSSKIIADAEAERFKYAERSVTLTRERAGLLEKIKKSESLNLGRETEIFKNSLTELDKKIKEAKDSEAKKDKGPKAKGSSFGGVASDVSLVDNTSNIQRLYSSELSKTEKFVKSQRDILKLSFEAGLVSRGEYVARDVDLITSGQSQELDVITKYGKQIEAENARMVEAVKARQSDALAATRDPASIKKINLTADDELKKLEEYIKTFRELQSDKTGTIAFESNKRYYESLKEQNAAMQESKKHLEDLNKTMQDAAEIRALEAQSQWDTMLIAGDELASYKARNEALKDYVKLQSKLRIDADKSGEVYQQMTSGVGPQSEEVQQRAFQQWMLWQGMKDQVVKAGIDGEEAARKASMDAVNKYYLDKAMEVRDGTAAAITEGIMNGGKAGSDAIKNVLNNVLRDMLNNVFKSMLGSIGNTLTQALSGQQQQSSGGGFLQSIVGFGLNALAGGFGGGYGASTGSSTYSLGSSGVSTSGFRLGRAVGGFVNQGTEYLVGENGPEKFIPKQSGSIVPNHKLAKTSASSDPLKVTIINNTSAPIGKVTERQISPTERALVIEEAVQAVASAMHDPNHKVSKSLGQNYKMQRNR